MKVILDREDLENLLRISQPPYDLFDHPWIKHSGSYTGGFVDTWNWNYSFDEKFTNEDLWSLYTLIKTARKR